METFVGNKVKLYATGDKGPRLTNDHVEISLKEDGIYGVIYRTSCNREKMCWENKVLGNVPIEQGLSLDEALEKGKSIARERSVVLLQRLDIQPDQSEYKDPHKTEWEVKFHPEGWAPNIR